MVTNKVEQLTLFSSNVALSNKQHSLLQHGDKFDTPGSDVLLFFSGIQPAIVGYNGVTDNAKAM